MSEKHNKSNIFNALVGRLGAVIAAALFVVLSSIEPVFAQPSVGEATLNFVDSLWLAPGIIAGVSYLTGLIFAVTAILKLKEHVENPNQTPIWEFVKRFAAGGALFALPMITQALYLSLVGSSGGAGFTYSGFSGSTSGGGLDTMLVSLMEDIWQPMLILVAVFGYLAGLIFVMIGILRLLKSSQDGPRGPGGFGTIMTFVVAAALFSLDEMMEAFSYSIFGSATSATGAVMTYAKVGLTDVEHGHVQAVISAVVAFVIVIGWISFIRGWFILRGVAEGNQQSSLMAGVTHLIAGALCANIGAVLNAVQITLDLVGVGVQFT